MRFSTRKDKVPLKDRIVLSIEDVAALSGFGLTTIYSAMRERRLISRKEGARTVILREDFDAWIKNLPPKPAKEACNG